MKLENQFCLNGIKCSQKIDPKECHLLHCTVFSESYRGENVSCTHKCSLCHNYLKDHCFIINKTNKIKFELDDGFVHSFCASIIDYSNNIGLDKIYIINDIFLDPLNKNDFCIENSIFLKIPLKLSNHYFSAYFRIPQLNHHDKSSYQKSLSEYI